MEEIITASNLYKVYTLKNKKLFQKGDTKEIQALDGINFSIEKGEILGLIGSNGAGKSTLIKLMSGIIEPTSGNIQLWGLPPSKNRKKNSYRIGIMMGQRSQLWWELPARNSFELYKLMYNISENDYKRRMDMYCSILDIDKFINQPVRKLSLGQRMRCELAVSMLHAPEILFLDEPTIGIDILAKERIIDFIQETNKLSKNIVVITSHDVVDIEHISKKIMVLNKGKIVYNDTKDNLKSYSQIGVISIEFSSYVSDFSLEGIKVIKFDNYHVKFSYDKTLFSSADMANIILSSYPVKDIAIENVDIEMIVKDIYKSPL